MLDFQLFCACIVSIVVVCFSLLYHKCEHGALYRVIYKLLCMLAHHHFRWSVLGVLSVTQTCEFFNKKSCIWEKCVLQNHFDFIMINGKDKLQATKCNVALVTWLLMLLLGLSLMSFSCHLKLSNLWNKLEDIGSL